MSETLHTSNPPPPAAPPTEAPEPPQAPPAEEPKRAGFFSGLVAQARKLGWDAASVAIGRMLGDVAPDAPSELPPSAGMVERPRETPQLAVLQRVAEKLRGVADEYIAAKLDEIEARVDQKLDHIEQRVDQKLQALHEQFRVLRDQEVRHRLRLLNLTLAFAMLVALLSLGYKLVVRMFLSN